MNSLVTTSALSAILSLAVATTAGAVEPNSIGTGAKPAVAQGLIAQTQIPPDSRPYRQYIANRRSLDDMIIMRMKMVGAAQEMLQSTQDTALKRLAQEMITSGNSEITRMMEMRKNMFPADID